LYGNVPKREKQLKQFAEATTFRQKFLDDVRFYLELKHDLLPRQRMEFVEKAVEIKTNGFHGSRITALKFCIGAFKVIYATNSAVVLKAVFGRI